MRTTQTVTIIGAAGSMGSAIARSLAGSRYRLLLASRDVEGADALAREINVIRPSEAEVEAASCDYDASWEAHIIILALPHAADAKAAEKIRVVANGKVVISIANPLNENFDGLTTSPDTSAAEELQKLLPNSKVVKAFNTTFAGLFAQPVIAGQQADAFVAGNDPEAVETACEFVRTAGFNPIVAGDLTTSRTLERMQLLLIQLGLKYTWLAGWKILHH